MTKGQAISRLRRTIKADTQDALTTDRYLYSVLRKYASLILRRQDGANKLLLFTPLFQSLTIELEEVDRIKDNCRGLKSGCTIKRSISKFDQLLEGYYGPLIKSVSSIDDSEIFVKTTLRQYNSMSSQKNFKYDHNQYYWFQDGRFYFPDLEYDSVNIEVGSDEDLSGLEGCNRKGKKLPECTQMQDQELYIPEYLFADIEKLAFEDLGFMLKIPTDTNDDKQSLQRD